MVKIKMEHRGKELWFETDVNNYIIHEGYSISKLLDGTTSEQRIRPRYYTDFNLALESILTIGVRASDATTLHELYNEVIELKSLILNKVSL